MASTTNKDTHQFIEKDIVCPACKNQFKALTPRITALRMRREHGDFFYAEYEGPNPHYYAVYVCHNCLYAAYEEDFLELRGNARESIQADTEERRRLFKAYNFEGERSISTVQASYVLALRCYEVRKKMRIATRASLYLLLSWLARDAGNAEQDLHYTKIALKFYRDSYSEEMVLNEKDEIKQTFLIGDLLFHLGEYRESVRWFQETLQHPAIQNYPEINRRIRDRWSSAREAALQKS